MTTMPETQKKVWTEAALCTLPDDGYLREVVDGELVISPKHDFFHGRICMRLLAALHGCAVEHRLGAVVNSSTGFWMQNRNCRAPDISFVTRQRLAQVCHAVTKRELLGPGASLDGEQLLPGFRFPIADLFKEWEWE